MESEQQALSPNQEWCIKELLLTQPPTHSIKVSLLPDWVLITSTSPSSLFLERERSWDECRQPAIVSMFSMWIENVTVFKPVCGLRDLIKRLKIKQTFQIFLCQMTIYMFKLNFIREVSHMSWLYFMSGLCQMFSRGIKSSPKLKRARTLSSTSRKIFLTVTS